MSAAWSFRLAARHAQATAGRCALSVLAIALGVALVVATQQMNDAVGRAFTETIDGIVGRAALTITAGDGVPFAEDVLERVRAVDGVEHAAPLVTGVAFPDDGSGELLSVYGIDVGDDAAVRMYHRGDTGDVVDDLLEFLNARDSIVLGREFAERRELHVGDILTLVTPHGPMPFRIHGLLSPEGMARTFGGRLVVMDVFAAQLAFTARGQLDQIDVVVAPGMEETVATALQARLPPGLHVEQPAVRKDVIRNTIRGLQALLTAFAALAVVAGFVICYGRLLAIFTARTWEIGLMRAVGLRRTTMFVELVKESVLFGLAGTAIGIPLGVVIARRCLPIVATTAALQYRLPVPNAAIAADIASLATGAAVGIGAAVLAAIVPAMHLARRPPAAAIAARGRETPADSRRRGAAALAAGVVAIGLLVVLQHVTRSAAVGAATTALMVLLSASSARPLVQAGSGVLRRIPPLLGPWSALGAGQIARHPTRTALTVAALGIGLGTTLMGGIVAWSLETTLVRQVASRLKADIAVTSAFESGGWVSAPLGEDVGPLIAATPGVDAVAATAFRDIRFRDAYSGLYAYDQVCFHDTRVCQWSLEPGAAPDALTAVARGAAVLVSTSFARRHGIATGDLLPLDTATGTHRFRVAGIATNEPTESIVMSRAPYRTSWTDPKVRWFFVRIAESTPVDGVMSSLQRALGQTQRVRVRKVSDLVAYFGSQVRQAFAFVYLMQALTFAIVLVGISDTLTTSILDRTRELGMMRATGLRRAHLVGIVLAEGLTIGVLGLVLACGTGGMLSLFWVWMQFPALVGWELDLHVPGPFIVAAAGTALALCVLGALAPAIRAAHMDVAASLRAD